MKVYSTDFHADMMMEQSLAYWMVDRLVTYSDLKWGKYADVMSVGKKDIGLVGEMAALMAEM